MDNSFVSCTDQPGRRKTKCPCFRDNFECDAKCACRNCGNGNISSNNAGCSTGSPRRKQGHKTYVKQRTTEFLKREMNSSLPNHTWTDQETTTLLCCDALLSQLLGITKDMEKLHELYSVLQGNELFQAKPLCLRDKTLNMVKGKYELLERTQKIFR